jgi:hypothetical protein
MCCHVDAALCERSLASQHLATIQVIAYTCILTVISSCGNMMEVFTAVLQDSAPWHAKGQ